MRYMEAFLIQKGAYIDASYDEMVKEFGSLDDFYREGLGQGEALVRAVR